MRHRPTRVLAVAFAAAFPPLVLVLDASSLGAARAADSAPGVNLAPVATPTCSYVSGDTRIEAIQDGFEPSSSRDFAHRTWGNWPRRGTQWVQYEWSRPISTGRIAVYWWDDHRGVRLPKTCRLLYRKGGKLVPVGHPSGLGVAGDRYNVTTFDAARTDALRLEVEGSGNSSTGIIEWKVFDSGDSPDFPPRVGAGRDRTVVRGGRTWLRGEVKALEGKGKAPLEVTWSLVSGPGKARFEKPHALETTATFSAAGLHVLSLSAGKGPSKASSTLRVRVVEPPPARELELIDTGPYAIDSPLWSRRAKAIITHWIPHCIEKISDPNLPQGGINNFVEAAKKLRGEPHGGHRGYVFSNAWVYNTIESICLARMVDPQGDAEIRRAQERMAATLEDWIPKILAAQEPDGYLQTVFTLSDREHWSPRHRNDHEGYVAGYFLQAAVAHHMLTRGADTRLYDAAKRLADCWERHIGPPPKQEWFDGHQSMEMALVRFGRFVNRVEGEGRGEKYIALAKFLLDCRKGGHEYDQSHVPVVQQYEAVGHAVRASYSYAAMADVAMETGDTDYRSAVESLWDDIVNRKYYVTGGIGSGETSEGFGPAYSLRQNAYCESCSSCGLVFFQHKLGLTHHDATYADLYEETLYNALLGSLDLEGKNFYYQNPLDEGRLRYGWHGCPCCVGNIPRTLLRLPTWMYAKDSSGLYVNLFIGSRVKILALAGTDVEVVQKTDYPWSGKVEITLNPDAPRAFTLHVRSPRRSVSEIYRSTPEADGILAIAVNGSPLEPRFEKGYAVISRTWKRADRVSIELPMRPQRVKAREEVAATWGRVALRYGPLVYTLESVDQDIDGVLEPTAPLAAEWRGDLLDGVVVIRSRWADGSPLLAIPYYARANRAAAAGEGGKAPERVRSRVWIRDR